MCHLLLSVNPGLSAPMKLAKSLPEERVSLIYLDSQHTAEGWEPSNLNLVVMMKMLPECLKLPLL